MKKKFSEKKALGWIGLLLAVVAVNILASFIHGRYDLTEDKRYSLSAPTKKLLKDLDEPVRVEVFFERRIPRRVQKISQLN